jgi:hypothetical protein
MKRVASIVGLAGLMVSSAFAASDDICRIYPRLKGCVSFLPDPDVPQFFEIEKKLNCVAYESTNDSFVERRWAAGPDGRCYIKDMPK